MSPGLSIAVKNRVDLVVPDKTAVRRVQGCRIRTSGVSESIPTPSTFDDLPVNTGGLSAGDWVQVIVDEPAVGSGGYYDDWGRWNGASFDDGNFQFWDPGGSQTGHYRVWSNGDVTWNNGPVVDPPAHLLLEHLIGCEVIIEDVVCYGPILTMRDCAHCTVKIANSSGSNGKAFKVAVQQLGRCHGNVISLNNVSAPGTVVRNDDSQGTYVYATGVHGCSIFHDAGVGHDGGRNTLARKSVWEGEFIVDSLASGLSGSGLRSRLYWDDFSSWETARNLVLTGDDSDYDVRVGGGSYNTILTSGTHLEEDRSAFMEYATWFPEGAVDGVWPPDEPTDNYAEGGFS